MGGSDVCCCIIHFFHNSNCRDCYILRGADLFFQISFTINYRHKTPTLCMVAKSGLLHKFNKSGVRFFCICSPTNPDRNSSLYFRMRIQPVVSDSLGQQLQPFTSNRTCNIFFSLLLLIHSYCCRRITVRRRSLVLSAEMRSRDYCHNTEKKLYEHIGSKNEIDCA